MAQRGLIADAATQTQDASFAAQLAAGMPIAASVAVVVAHPDDETLGLGARLRRLRDLRLIHLTDGAPRDLHDAQRAGCADAAHYAAQRRHELDAALHVLGATPSRVLAYGCPDQQALEHLVPLTHRLERDLAGCTAVITHAYEHGHPDHDAAAFAVHAACTRLHRAGATAPVVIEFAGYHLRDDRVEFGSFWTPSASHEHVAQLTANERAMKARAVACFASQRDFLASFPLDRERYRRAPAYAFTQPAPPGAAFYERLGWGVTSARWRTCAAAALEHLQLYGAL